MVLRKVVVSSPSVLPKPFRVYRIVRAGSSRYLNVGRVLPLNWTAVKVTVEELKESFAILRLEQIK